MTSADFDNSDLIDLSKLPDDPDLGEFEEEYKRCQDNLDTLQKILKIPLERHYANLEEREEKATESLNIIKQARKNGHSELEHVHTQQYMLWRDLAKDSLEKCLKFQKLYYYIETQVYGKLEESLVYQHLSKAGVNLLDRAVKAKKQATKNSQEMSAKFDEIDVALETMSRKMGVDNGMTNLTETSESFSNERTEETYEKYLEEINKRINLLSDPDSLPPANGK